jgi:hypothetical protein
VGGNMLKKPVMQKEKKTKKILAQSWHKNIKTSCSIF